MLITSILLFIINNPKDITARELKVGSRYRYYWNGKLEKCRTLKVKRSFSDTSYSLGWDMGWKPRKQFKWGGIVSARKDVAQFRPCKNKTTKTRKQIRK